MSVVGWLTANGFVHLIALDESFDSLAELLAVTTKMVVRLGGTAIDRERLVALLKTHLDAKRADEVSAQTQETEALLRRLPVFVADLYQQMLDESHPRVRLVQLFDVAEMVTRWVAGALISALRDPDSKQISEEVAKLLRSEIERPSFGKWVGILRTVARKTPRQPRAVVAALARWSLAAGRVGKNKAAELAAVLDPMTSDRNHLIHGGSGTMQWCKDTYDKHAEQLQRLVTELALALDGVAILGVQGDQCADLKGPTGGRILARPKQLQEDGIWLLCNGDALLLWPLVRQAPRGTLAGSGGAVGGVPIPQVYISAKNTSELLFQPPAGCEEPVTAIRDEAFRAFFLLDRKTITLTPGQRFVDAALQEADQLLGRTQELQAVTTWLRTAQATEATRIGMIYGGPGLGKSLLMSAVVAQIVNQRHAAAKGKGYFYCHRFRQGGTGNSPGEFWAGLLAALSAGEADETMPEKATDLQRVRQRLKGLKPGAAEAGLTCLIDGLDEVSMAHPQFAKDLAESALPGTTWLIASRPEPGIARSLAIAEEALEGGLQPMGSDGIREMLVSTLPSSVRNTLLRLDKDDKNHAAGPQNDYVQAVVERAAGNPLYVHYLIEDLEKRPPGEPLGKSQLPDGLVGYYRELLNRLGASDAGRLLPLVVALLACADEPLTRAALQALITPAPSSQALDDALIKGGAMFRVAATPDGDEGLALYHTNFREHVLGPDNALRGTVAEAKDMLWRKACGWASLPSGGLRNHLFRCGNGYALAWGDDVGRHQVAARLQDFPYTMTRLAAPETASFEGLLHEYERLRSAGSHSIVTWADFFKSVAHLLRQGNSAWPANRILFQLAMDEPLGSLPNSSAQAYEHHGGINWRYLKTIDWSGRRGQPSVTLDVNGIVTGVTVTSPDSLLSWDANGNVALWNTLTGKARWEKAIHKDVVVGTLHVDKDRYVSWSRDSTLALWSIDNGQILASADHRPPLRPLGVNGVCRVGTTQILSWSLDGCFRVWRIDDLRNQITFKGPEGIQACLSIDRGPILLVGTETVWIAMQDSNGWCIKPTSYTGALAITDRQVLLWDQTSSTHLVEIDTSGQLRVTHSIAIGCSAAGTRPDGSIMLFSAAELLIVSSDLSEILARERLLTQDASATLTLDDGRVVTVAQSILKVWNPKDGHVSMTSLDLATDSVRGVVPGPSGSVAIYTQQGSMGRVLVIDCSSGAELGVVRHVNWSNGASFLDPSRFVSWSDAADLRISSFGSPSSPLQKSSAEPGGLLRTLALDHDRILLWHPTNDMQLWRPDQGTMATLMPPLVDGTENFNDAAADHILFWNASCIHVRCKASLKLVAALRPRRGAITGACMTPDKRVIAWFENSCEIEAWALASPRTPSTISLPNPANGAIGLDDGRVVVWLANQRLLVLPPSKELNAIELNGDSCVALGDDGSRLRIPIQMQRNSITAVFEDIDGMLWSWSRGDSTLCRWDAAEGLLLEPPTKGVDDVLMLPHGWLAVWRRAHEEVNLRNLRTGQAISIHRSGLEVAQRPVWEACNPKQTKVIVRDEKCAFILDGLLGDSVDGPILQRIAQISKSIVEINAPLVDASGSVQEASASCRWYGNAIERIVGAWSDGRVVVAGLVAACIEIR